MSFPETHTLATPDSFSNYIIYLIILEVFIDFWDNNSNLKYNNYIYQNNIFAENLKSSRKCNISNLLISYSSGDKNVLIVVYKIKCTNKPPLTRFDGLLDTINLSLL
ncbi:MAG TPA: hypothetical protein DDX14_02835 [Cyanobacteria bacterium UBA9579]|nr:hypothetical protein [Cyanobacteria bacterium UBA9579]